MLVGRCGVVGRLNGRFAPAHPDSLSVPSIMLQLMFLEELSNCFIHFFAGGGEGGGGRCVTYKPFDVNTKQEERFGHIFLMTDSEDWRKLWRELIAHHDRDVPPADPAAIAARWEMEWPMVAEERNLPLELRMRIEQCWKATAPPVVVEDGEELVVEEGLVNDDGQGGKMALSEKTRDVYIQINAAQAWYGKQLAKPYKFLFEFHLLPNVQSLELVQLRFPPNAYYTVGTVFGSNFCVLSGIRDWTRSIQLTWKVPQAVYTTATLLQQLSEAAQQSHGALRGSYFSADPYTQQTHIQVGFARYFGPAHFRMDWTFGVENTLANYLGMVPTTAPCTEIVGQFVLPSPFGSDQNLARFGVHPDNREVVIVAKQGEQELFRHRWLLTDGLVDYDANRLYSRQALENAWRFCLAQTPWLHPERSQWVRETASTHPLSRYRWVIVPEDELCGELVAHQSQVRWVVTFPTETTFPAIWTGADSAFGFGQTEYLLGEWKGENPLSDATLMLPSVESTSLVFTPRSPYYSSIYPFTLTLPAGSIFTNLEALTTAWTTQFRSQPFANQSSCVATGEQKVQLNVDINVPFRLLWGEESSTETAPHIRLDWLVPNDMFLENPFVSAPTLVSRTSTTLRWQGSMLLQGTGYVIPSSFGVKVHLVDRNVWSEVVVAPGFVDSYRLFLQRWVDSFTTWTDADGHQPFQLTTYEIISAQQATLTYQLVIRLTKSFTENDYQLMFEGNWWRNWLGWEVGVPYLLNNQGGTEASLVSPRFIPSMNSFRVTDPSFVWATLTVDRPSSVGLWGVQTHSTQSSRQWPLRLAEGVYTTADLLNALNRWLQSYEETANCTITPVGDLATQQRYLVWNWAPLEASLNIDDFELVFYDLFWVPPSQCQEEVFESTHLSSATTSLGWMLGFRSKTRYGLTGSLVNGVRLASLVSEATVTTQSFQYAMLVVEDFVMNKQGTTILTSSNPANQRSKPASEHIGGMRRVCQATTNQSWMRNPIFYPNALLTRAQLFALGRVVEESKNNTNEQVDEGTAAIISQRQSAFQNNNLLGMVPLMADVTQELMYDAETNARGGSQARFRRSYFAPTSLDRLYVEVLTEWGTYLPLNTNNWMCLLLAKVKA